MKDFQREGLSHDPIHGYIPFVSRAPSDREVAERDLIDHPWVQRLRQIHQLQTAWWVYPTAEHTRFQHVIGAMHLASRAIDGLYDSLQAAAPDVPSRGYVECLVRMAALLHDVGHGPFGHFFDVHFLADYGLTHESLGAAIVRDQLGDLLRGVRRCPSGCLAPGEQLDPAHIAYLIQRPRADEPDSVHRWLALLRSLFCGIYTVDNMDFVLRDAFMTGYSVRAFDLERLLRYSFFSDAGLTIHPRGIDALMRFMQARAELFRSVYFHRTVRAIDLTLEYLFNRSKRYFAAGDPRHEPDTYREFTEWSLLVDVARWHHDPDPDKRQLGLEWRALLGRQLRWRAACERNVVFSAIDSEASSIFADAETFERRLRHELPATLSALTLRPDLPRHIHRPHTRGPVVHQNFLYDPARKSTRPLTDDQLFRQLPVSHRFCRIYVPRETPPDVDEQLANALDRLLGSTADDLTNM
ncbi:MAG: metal-dependent phosphohydrolase [Planctomycetes bacterium RBG_16_64_10]|nr:MAG: metal-dependent phosphohydrolase [Planctomycetes bacterium RBG_16_64_10]